MNNCVTFKLTRYNSQCKNFTCLRKFIICLFHAVVYIDIDSVKTSNYTSSFNNLYFFLLMFKEMLGFLHLSFKKLKVGRIEMY